ncbi:MAG: hypothetical protein ACOYB8_09490 [Eubacteriaceae bacterium]|jgi:hypothetical protein
MMKRTIKTVAAAGLMLALLLALTGCSQDSDVKYCVISPQMIVQENDLKNAEQADSFTAGQALYANVEYKASSEDKDYKLIWYQDGNTISTQTLTAKSGSANILVYSLPAARVTSGSWKIQIRSTNDKVIYSKDFTVQ